MKAATGQAAFLPLIRSGLASGMAQADSFRATIESSSICKRIGTHDSDERS